MGPKTEGFGSIDPKSGTGLLQALELAWGVRLDRAEPIHSPLRLSAGDGGL